jgi:hypothetical protein
MKKITLLLMVLILGTAAFAAAPKAAPKAAAPAVYVAPAATAKSPTIIGVEDGSPYMRFMMNRDQAVDVGFTYNNTNSANNNIFLWGRLNNKIGQVGAITTSWGAALSLWSGKQAGADCTILGLGGSVSAAYMILDNVEIYGNVNLLGLMNTSLAGASTTSYSMITGSGNCYSGIRVYL